MKPGSSPRLRVSTVPGPVARPVLRVMVWGIFLSCGLFACNGVERNADMHFGESYRQVFANQKLHPDAGTEGTAVEGLDGQKAVNIVSGYQNKPAPTKGGKSAAGSSGPTNAVLFTPQDGGTSEK